MLLAATYACAACGERVETAVDPSAGDRQTYVEDCQVCCRANVLRVTISNGRARLQSELE